MTVAALYVDPNGAYANLPGVEVWDEARDARTYDGPWPVVAHPPCASFRDPRGRAVVGAGIHSGQAAGRGRIDGRNASATPPAFRDVLLAMARSAAKREVCA